VSGRNVELSWQASSGTPVNGYLVKRYNGSGQEQTIGANCSGTISGTSCVEKAVPPGSWRYSITPVRQSWRGAESPLSAPAVVGAPALSLNQSSVSSLPATVSGQISDFIDRQSVTFRLDDPNTGQILTGSITPSPVPYNGTAHVSVTLPAGTAAGQHTIYAIGNEGDVAEAPLSVLAPAQGVDYLGTGNPVSRTNSGDLTAPYPAGTNPNDLLLLVVVNGADQTVSNLPTGWSILTSAGTGTPQQFRLTTVWKLAGAENSVSFRTGTNSNGATAWVSSYRRPGGGSPTVATAAARSGTATPAATLTPSPDVTTNANDATVISIAAARAPNTLSLGTPRGFAGRFATTVSADVGVGRSLGIADLAAPNAGTIPSPTWSQSGTAAQWAWATVAFR
jgi:hypothetical protein